MNYLCVICARKNSKGLKNKNLKKINGLPLIGHTIIQAKRSKIFSNITISTDSNKIRNISQKFGIKSWFLRPKHLSSDNISKVPVILHALKMSEKYFKKKFDIIVDLDVSSPLRKISDIKSALKKFLRSNSEIMFSVCRSKKNPYYNMVEKKNNKIQLVKISKRKILCRQKAPLVYDINASIYMWKRMALIRKKTLFSNKTSIYVMPTERSTDIDTISDWKLVKYFMDKKIK